MPTTKPQPRARALVLRKMKKLKCENSLLSVIARGARDEGRERCMVGWWCLGMGRYVVCYLFLMFFFFVDLKRKNDAIFDC